MTALAPPARAPVTVTREPDGAQPEELAEARVRLPGAEGDALHAFARRQRACRRALTLLADFYRTHPCRMARVHLLTASAVLLGRFWGISEAFARLGAAVMPIDGAGRPRTAAWRAYARACSDGQASYRPADGPRLRRRIRRREDPRARPREG